MQVPRALRGREPLLGAREAAREADRRRGRVGRVAAELERDPAGAVGVVDRELALHARAENGHVVRALLPRRPGHGLEVEQRADEDEVTARGGGEQEPRPVRRRQDERLRRGLDELARRVAEVEAVDPHGLALAAEDGAALGLRDRARLVDLGAAEDAPIARGERLRDRRGGPQDVDDDPDRGRDLLGRGERDVDSHGRVR